MDDKELKNLADKIEVLELAFVSILHYVTKSVYYPDTKNKKVALMYSNIFDTLATSPKISGGDIVKILTTIQTLLDEKKEQLNEQKK